MASFNNRNVAELVKDYLSVNEFLHLDVYINNNTDRASLEAAFDGRTAAAIIKLEEYMREMNVPTNPGEITIREAVKQEIYDKFSVDEYATLSKNDLLNDARIDWTNIIIAYRNKFGTTTNAPKMNLIFGSTLLADSSFTKANLNQIALTGIYNQIKRELNDTKTQLSVAQNTASKQRKSKIGAVLVAAGTTVAAVMLAIGLLLKSGVPMTDIKDAAAENDRLSSIITAYEREHSELDAFQSKLNSYARNGISKTEEKELREDIKAYTQPYDASIKGYSTSPQMEAMLENAINLENINNSLADKDKEISKIKTDFTNSQDDLTDAQDALVKAQDELAKLQASYDQLVQSGGATVPTDVVEIVQKIVKVSNLLNTSLSNGSLSSSEKTEVKTAIDELQGYQGQVSIELGRFGLDIETIMKSIDFAIADLESDIDDLELEIKDLKDDLKNANSSTEVTKLKAEIKTLESKIKTLETKVAELEEQLKNSGSDPDLAKQLAQAKADLKTANATISSLQSENATLKSNIGTLESEVASLKTSITTLTSENTNLTNQCSDYVKQMAKINQENTKLVADYNAKVSEYNTLKGQYDELNNKYQQLLSGSGSSAEKEELLQQIQSLQSQLTKKSSELEEAYSNISDLQAEIEQLKLEIAGLISQLETGDLSVLRAIYESLTGMNANNLSKTELESYICDALGIDYAPSSSGNNFSGEGVAPER